MTDATRLVVIDDSVSFLQFVSGLVARNFESCEVVPFTDPTWALDACLNDRDIDLIVVDYAMGPPDGLGFIESYTQAAKDRIHRAPIIMVTGEHHRIVRYMALQMGASDFLQKPLDEIEFIARVGNLMRLSQLQRAQGGRTDWLEREVRRATRSIVEREREAVLALSRAAEHRDPETGGHLIRMANYSRMIAAHLGLPPEEMDLIFAAAPMHDVGKIGIPDSILLKAGPLTPDEVRIMRLHTIYGFEILDGSQSPLLRLAAQVALTHHERFDGRGYPHGLIAAEIPIAGRIVALADVFDALTSTRPYKQAWPPSRARDWIVSSRGGHFDSDCVDALLAEWPMVERMALDRPPLPSL